jgi:hypothetical protein
MKLALVTGSKDWSDSEAIYAALDAEKPDIVLNGGATGSDSIASAWAHHRGVALLIAPALWNAMKKRAGPIRNSLMEKVVYSLLAGWPDPPHNVVVIAAPLPESRGTYDMVGKCERHHWRIRIVPATQKIGAKQ